VPKFGAFTVKPLPYLYNNSGDITWHAADSGFNVVKDDGGKMPFRISYDPNELSMLKNILAELERSAKLLKSQAKQQEAQLLLRDRATQKIAKHC